VCGKSQSLSREPQTTVCCFVIPFHLGPRRASTDCPRGIDLVCQQYALGPKEHPSTIATSWSEVTKFHSHCLYQSHHSSFHRRSALHHSPRAYVPDIHVDYSSGDRPTTGCLLYGSRKTTLHCYWSLPKSSQRRRVTTWFQGRTCHDWWPLRVLPSFFIQNNYVRLDKPHGVVVGRNTILTLQWWGCKWPSRWQLMGPNQSTPSRWKTTSKRDHPVNWPPRRQPQVFRRGRAMRA
jgi:hypothetical protein